MRKKSGETLYELVFTVKEMQKDCPAGLKVGDKLVYREPNVILEDTDKICVFALGSILPYISALVRESREEGDWIPKKEEIICPDPSVRVVFKITRRKV